MGIEAWGGATGLTDTGWIALGVGAAVAVGVAVAVIHRWRQRTSPADDTPRPPTSPTERAHAAMRDILSSDFHRTNRGRIAMRAVIDALPPAGRQQLAIDLLERHYFPSTDVARQLAWVLRDLIGTPPDWRKRLIALVPPALISVASVPTAIREEFALQVAELRTSVVRSLRWTAETPESPRVGDNLAQATAIDYLVRSLERLRELLRTLDSAVAVPLFPACRAQTGNLVQRLLYAVMTATLLPALPARERLGAVLPLLDTWIAGDAVMGRELRPVLDLFHGGEALTVVRRLQPGLHGPEVLGVAQAIVQLLPRLRPGKRHGPGLHVLTTLFQIDARALVPSHLLALGAAIPNESLPLLVDEMTALLGPQTLSRLLPLLEQCWPRVKPSQRGPILQRLAGIASEAGLRTTRARQELPENAILAVFGLGAQAPEPPPLTDADRIARLLGQSSAQDARMFFLRLIRQRQKRPSGFLREQFEDQCRLFAQFLKRHERMEVTAQFVEQYGLDQLPLPIVAMLLARVSAPVFLDFATARTDRALLVVARYAHAGLPWETWCWAQYGQAGWSETFLARAGKAVEGYRRGAALRNIGDATEQRWAYAALGQPKGLSFEQFVQGLRQELPPSSFFPASFQLRVPEVASCWAQIDRAELLRNIREACGWIDAAATAADFYTATQQLCQNDSGLRDRLGPRPSQRTLDTWIAQQAGALWADPALRTRTGVAEWLRLALVRNAWSDAQSAGLRETIGPLRTQLPRLGTQAWLAGARALEELLRDRLADAAQRCGITLPTATDDAANALAAIVRVQQALAHQLQQGDATIVRTVAVECVPSRSQADRFLHFVADDCTRSAAIDSPDFQMMRMVTEQRFVGPLYFERVHIVGTSLTVLVIALEPRPEWSIDYAAFLAEIERQLPPAAEQAGFGAVLLMNNASLQSNRVDLIDAIGRRDYPALTLPARFGRVSIFHSGFHFPPHRGVAPENQATVSFLVLWQHAAAADELARVAIASDEPDGRMRWPILAAELEAAEFAAGQDAIDHEEPPARPRERAERRPFRPQPAARPEPPAVQPVAPQDAAEEEIEFVLDFDNAAADDIAATPPLTVELHAPAPIAEAPVIWPRGQPRPVVVQNEMNGYDRAAAQAMLAQLAHQVPAELQQALLTAPRDWWPMMAAAMAEAGLAADAMMANGGAFPGAAEPQHHPQLEQRRFPPVVEGTLVLQNRPLMAILLNRRVTRLDRGWVEPTLDGKTHVIDVERGWGALPETGTEVTPQDLFDFYNVVFYQARHCHAFLLVLQRCGANVMPLGGIIAELDAALTASLEALLRGNSEEALQILQGVDATMSHFRAVMRTIANTVNIEVDPITGWIYPLHPRHAELRPPELNA
ncbi:MAG: hypothetical protein HY696_05420 [Deltaproteobacteria bacterium]|nr:hypothetical protein [Deltaproteobacteria bacterium]